MARYNRGNAALQTQQIDHRTPLQPRPKHRARRISQQSLWLQIRDLMPGRAVLPDSALFEGLALAQVTPLSATIITHLRSCCPIANDGRTVAQTHRLVYIPAHLDGEETSIGSLRAFGAARRRNTLPLFSSLGEFRGEVFEKTPLSGGIWVLQYSDIVPHSTCFSDGAPLSTSYRTARAIEHIGVLILTALEHGERLFPTTYGRTTDRFTSGDPVCAGNLYGGQPVAPNGSLHSARVGRVVVWSAAH